MQHGRMTAAHSPDAVRTAARVSARLTWACTMTSSARSQSIRISRAQDQIYHARHVTGCIFVQNQRSWSPKHVVNDVARLSTPPCLHFAAVRLQAAHPAPPGCVLLPAADCLLRVSRIAPPAAHYITLLPAADRMLIVYPALAQPLRPPLVPQHQLRVHRHAVPRCTARIKWRFL